MFIWVVRPEEPPEIHFFKHCLDLGKHGSQNYIFFTNNVMVLVMIKIMIMLMIMILVMVMVMIMIMVVVMIMVMS